MQYVFQVKDTSAGVYLIVDIYGPYKMVFFLSIQYILTVFCQFSIDPFPVIIHHGVIKIQG